MFKPKGKPGRRPHNPPPIQREEVLFIRRLPNNIKNQFKAWCAKRDITMTDAVIEMMFQLVMTESDYLVIADIVEGSQARRTPRGPKPGFRP